MSLNRDELTDHLSRIGGASRKSVLPYINDLFTYIKAEARNNEALARYESDRTQKWAEWGPRRITAWEMPIDLQDRKSLAYHLYHGVVECGDPGNGMLLGMYGGNFEQNTRRFQEDFFDLLMRSVGDILQSEQSSYSGSASNNSQSGAAMSPATTDDEKPMTTALTPDPKKVFIIHGRNIAAQAAMEHFLKALGLQPIDFDQLSADEGGTAFVGDIVRAGLKKAHGIVALFTPDEYAALRPDHRDNGQGVDLLRWQARPNVIFEAGMAYGMARERTILVTIGTDVSLFSDVAGIHVVRLSNHVESRKRLRQKLIGVRCSVDLRDDSWTDPTRSGDFETCIKQLREVSPRDPF